MKKLLLFLAACCTALFVNASKYDAKLGEWRIVYNQASKSFDVFLRQKPVLQHVIPEATWEDENGAATLVSSKNSSSVSCKKREDKVYYEFMVSDVAMVETFELQDNYLLVQLKLKSTKELKSRYLAPIAIRENFSLFPAAESNRMLKVPFDNDDFVRYHKNRFGSSMTSFEVGALYDAQSREGLVVGSVDHNRWKSGVIATTKDDGSVDTLLVFSGISHKETRDILPHGALVGKEIASARYFLGYFPDWRDGMETFAHANTRVVPRRETWKGGTPFGWQSWGVMSTKNNFQCDIAVSDYFHDVLQPNGFCNEQGQIVMSIDAWDNLNPRQKKELCEHCEKNNQIPGTYWTPFCLWWDEARLHQQLLPGQDIYMADECVLKANGEYIKYDGAYCLDPTHPGVKAWIAAELAKIKGYGFRYLKIDFTDNGIIQADSYFNPAIHTGVEAYNEGFTYFLKEADIGEPLFIALSIAPIFPYQYGNSRRIACDTWGRISHAEYSMNAIGGGWWHGILYQYNDPDHCPLIGVDNDRETSPGENRARITNLCAAGMVLISDNFDLKDETGKGDPKLSRERAPQILFNAEINAIGRLGRAFRPIYGDREHAYWPWTSESFFQLDTEEYTYVAVINYKEEPLEGTITAERMGLSGIGETTELWYNTPVTITSEGLPYSVPGKDARVYKICK